MRLKTEAGHGKSLYGRCEQTHRILGPRLRTDHPYRPFTLSVSNAQYPKSRLVRLEIEFKEGLLTVLDLELAQLIFTDCVETGKNTTVENY